MNKFVSDGVPCEISDFYMSMTVREADESIFIEVIEDIENQRYVVKGGEHEFYLTLEQVLNWLNNIKF